MPQFKNITVDDDDIKKMMDEVVRLDGKIRKLYKRVIPEIKNDLKEAEIRLERLRSIGQGKIAETMDALSILYGIEEIENGYSWHFDINKYVLRKRRNPQHMGRLPYFMVGNFETEDEEWKNANKEEVDEIDFFDDGEALKKKNHFRKKYKMIDWEDEDESNSEDDL